MHYKDGREARLGDIVRGRGYNRSYEVQGLVVGLTSGQDSCNIHVMVPEPYQPLGTETVGLQAVLVEEHGTCADFVLIHRVPQ